MPVTSLEHQGGGKNFLEGPKFLKLCPIKPVTSLGHQIGQKVFWEGPKFFKISPVVLNYAWHIFPGGRKIFLGDFAPLGYGAGRQPEFFKF